jgi:CheY-like chemotaxis protein
MAKILLVEDDKSLREIYGVRLMAEGYEIVSAGDGEEALALAIKERPDLIVSDVMMPKISGFDMLDILRSTSETKDVKVIMMTALSSDDQRARGESLGADRYLVKSQVGIEDVVRTVHDVLGDSIAAPAPAAPTFPSSAPTQAPVVAPAAPAPAPAPTPEAFPAAPAAAPTPDFSMPTPQTAPAMPAYEAAPAPAVEPAPYAPTPEAAPLAPAPETPSAYAPIPQPAPTQAFAPAPAPTADPVATPELSSAPASVAPVAQDPAYAPAPEAPAPAPAPMPEAFPAAPAVAPAPAPLEPTFNTAPAPAPVAPLTTNPVLSELPANPVAMPQPTAPFSSPAPVSLGERIIEPLTSPIDNPTGDIAAQMEQALNAQQAAPTPAPQGQPPVPPTV